MAEVAVVIPTVGRPSLRRLLASLAGARGPLPTEVIVVDDRRDCAQPLLGPSAVPDTLQGRLKVLRGRAAGPAAARNTGWRATGADWVAFLDDDVVVEDHWLEQLAGDVANAPADVAGIQGTIRVPLPPDRPATDWERNVAGLQHAQWATADLAYRRSALEAVGGFDERFPRAYREDSDLGLRLSAAGWRILKGRRAVTHPVRPADPFVSVRLQAGNADDAFMRALHGRGWRTRAGASKGRRGRHLAITAAGLIALAASVRGRRGAALAGVAAWALGTAEFAWRRIAPGPRTPSEVASMLATSVAIPPAATVQWLRGWLRAVRELGRPAGSRRAHQRSRRPAAVLFDRDGTLIVDVPYNGDPAKVIPMAGAREAVDRLRRAGIPTAVISNQSGVARGLLTRAQLDAVNARVDELLGPLGPWVVCMHGPGEGCACRKPQAGLVRRAAALLGVDPRACVVVGDIGSDVDAARAAGARSILVPTPATLPDEVAGVPAVAQDLPAAVNLILEEARS